MTAESYTPSVIMNYDFANYDFANGRGGDGVGKLFSGEVNIILHESAIGGLQSSFDILHPHSDNCLCSVSSG